MKFRWRGHYFTWLPSVWDSVRKFLLTLGRWCYSRGGISGRVEYLPRRRWHTRVWIADSDKCRSEARPRGSNSARSTVARSLWTRIWASQWRGVAFAQEYVARWSCARLGHTDGCSFSLAPSWRSTCLSFCGARGRPCRRCPRRGP